MVLRFVMDCKTHKRQDSLFLLLLLIG